MATKDPSNPAAGQSTSSSGPGSSSSEKSSEPRQANKEQISDYISGHEGGFVDTAYNDTEGHKTVGIGFNLDRSDAQEKIEALGLNFNDVYSGKTKLTEEQANTLFSDDLDDAIDHARNTVSNFDDLSAERQAVVVDMAYNLGGDGFAGFTDTINAIENNDWQAAAQGMEDSKWFDQVGNRAQEDVSMMTGDSSFSGS